VKAAFYFQDSSNYVVAKQQSKYGDIAKNLAVFSDDLKSPSDILEVLNGRLFIPYTEFAVPLGETHYFFCKLFILQGIKTQTQPLNILFESDKILFYVCA
jgi:hypothetical protein